jgi:predicted 3-demethylubiquinone-9 3-methyltransferase (glyoxalase superfamily)
LWCDNQAEEAGNFYVAIFNNSKIGTIARYGDDGPGQKGTLMTVQCQLDGQEFTALNGGPMFKFNESISFVLKCETQEEVDYYWEKLVQGVRESQCGWLKDKFGLSWQIVPTDFIKWMRDKDPAKMND